MKEKPSKRFGRSGALRAGHTLAEVVLALALFSLLAYAAVTAMASGLEVMAAERETDPRMDDERVVRHAIMAVGSRSELEAGGEVYVPSGQQVRWTAEPKPTNLLGVHHLEVTMRWQGGDGPEAEVERELFLYRPAWSDSREQEQLREHKMEWFEERRRDRRGEDE